MAVQAMLFLLATVLPCAALAAFSPDFSFFLACGANSSVSFPSDSPARTFVPDTDYLSPVDAPAVFASSTPASPPALYTTARADISAFSYRLPYPASLDGSSFLVLRLHFFPFFPANSSQSVVNISSSRFAVSILDAYAVMSTFRPPATGGVKEFFIPRGALGGHFTVTFVPDAGSSAFVNAVELFPAPPELLWNNTATPVDPVGSNDLPRWQQDALETVYRLNVGGPKVTKENDTLWRTWLPDGPYLYGAPGQSEVNSTSNPIIYDPSKGYSREVAPDVVYQTQRMGNYLSWTFPGEPDSRYLVRLHFCDYEALSSVVGVGIVFDVDVGQGVASTDLTPNARATQSNEAFYMDYVAKAPSAGAGAGNLKVSIGGGMLNGLEIMRLLPVDLRSRGSLAAKRTILITMSAMVGMTVLACVVLGFFAVPYRKDGASGWAEQLMNRSRDGKTSGIKG